MEGLHMEQSKEYITAIHEAAHAVMCAICGFTIKYVTIIPTGDRFGEFDKVPWHYEEGDAKEVIYNKTLADAIIRFAGFVAERDMIRVELDQCVADAIIDIKTMQDIIFSVYANDNESYDKLLTEIPIMTAYVIQKPIVQQQIKAVADALMEHKTLTNEQVVGIMSIQDNNFAPYVYLK